EACTPHERVDHYTQAIMDLGATLCTRSRPDCARCPLAADCVAHARGLEDQLPTPRPRQRERRVRRTHMLLAVHEGGRVLLEQRPPRGLWGGLWGLPEFDEASGAAHYARQTLGVVDPVFDALPT